MANNVIVLSDSDDDNSGLRGPIYQRWLFCDELLTLTTLATERHRSGEFMSSPDLFDAVRGDLWWRNVASKVQALKTKFRKALRDGSLGNDDRDQRLYELSMVVWPDEEE